MRDHQLHKNLTKKKKTEVLPAFRKRYQNTQEAKLCMWFTTKAKGQQELQILGIYAFHKVTNRLIFTRKLKKCVNLF